MTKLDEREAHCQVFTFKEGALSALAHDLALEVDRWSVEIGADHTIDARFDAGSLRVLHALRDGRPTQALSQDDKHKIERAIHDEVLDVGRHPEIRFSAPPPTPDGAGFAVAGELVLCGHTRPLALSARLDGGHQVAEVVLHQPDFGIRPYRALLGALRVRADVKVRVTLPWPLPNRP